MSFVGSGLIVNTAGLYFDALGQDLGISRTAAAFPVSVRLIVSSLAMLLFGRVFSRLNLRVALSVCVIVCTTAFLACAWFDSAWQFDAAFAVMGASYVVPVTLAPPVLLSMWFPTRFGTVMGIAGCLSGLGGAVFNPLVSHMITAYGWRTAYAATGVTVLLLLLPFAATVMERPSPRNAPDVQKSQTNIPDASLSDSQKKYRRHLAFGLLLLSMVLLQIASGINQHVPAHELAVGLTLGQASMVVSARMIGSAVGKSTLGLLLDGRRPSLVMGLYSVIGWIGWIGIWLATSASIAMGASLCAGVGQAILLTALPWTIRQVAGEGDYARPLSVITATGQATVAIATTVHGLMFDATGSYSLSLAGNVAWYLVASTALIAALHLCRSGHVEQ